MNERWQLRDYTIKPGELDAWIEEWRTRVAPLRESLGFKVVAAWLDRESSRFVWLLRYRGDSSFEDADKAYYESPERKAMSPDPARHITHNDTRFVEPVQIVEGA